jgi:hypothetical protein
MTPVVVLASLIIAGYAAWYALLCAFAPFGPCRRCDGTGRLPKPTPRRPKLGRRECPRCDGTARRVRVGRRLHTWLRAEYRQGTR